MIHTPTTVAGRLRIVRTANGYEDAICWRHLGLAHPAIHEASQVAEMEFFLGRGAGDILDSVHEWALNNATAIERVAAALKDPEQVVMSNDSAEWCLSSASVEELIYG